MADAEHAGEEQFVSLYRRFRPGRFSELRGQPHVVRALQGAVRDGRVAHAYLFSGPRGTGKTSTARILARALDCAAPVDGEPCGTCPSCVEIARGNSLDVHELDAASNNGVDAIRDLISHAALATPGRWKVYIVDEVHMLSGAAANALLKTLEEPPGHVVFVLATTDPQKVPPTIRSRTQHFEFGLLGADTLTELLRDVRSAAGLSLEDDTLAVAVRKGRGSARDALSALDQVAAAGTADALRPEVVELTEALAEEDARRALVSVAGLTEAGWGPQQLATELVDELRQAFLVALAPELCAAAAADRERLGAQAARIGLPRLVRSMEALGRAQVDMREAPDPRAVLEVALVRLTRPELDDTPAALVDRVARLEQALAHGPAPSPATAPVAPGPTAPAGTGPPATAPRMAPAGPPPPATAPTDAGERPGFGVLRRQRATTPVEGPPAPEPPPAAPPPAPPSPAAGVPPSPAPAETVASGGGALPDRDALVQAWGDHILHGLPARAKALYIAGRFVAMDGATATFALPNAAHRDRCEEARHLVEEAVSGYFSVPVTFRLTVDDGRQATGGPAGGSLPPPGMPPSGMPPSGTAPPGTAPTGPSARPGPGAVTGPEPPAVELDLDPDDDFDPDGPAETGSVESVAQARLLEAFPGAEEVSG